MTCRVPRTVMKVLHCTILLDALLIKYIVKYIFIATVVQQMAVKCLDIILFFKKTVYMTFFGRGQ